MRNLSILSVVLFLALSLNCCAKKEKTEATETLFGKATKVELSESFELGATPDAETIAKFQEKANKTFSMYRGYCYEEESWLNSAWESDIKSPAKAASDHSEKTGHSTGVRWK